MRILYDDVLEFHQEYGRVRLRLVWDSGDERFAALGEWELPVSVETSGGAVLACGKLLEATLCHNFLGERVAVGLTIHEERE